MEPFGVAIGTYGSFDWIELAEKRAVQSVIAQTVEVPYQHVHHETLARARNEAARRLDVKNLIFLDADDELDPGYIEAMFTGTPGSLRQPSTAGVYADGFVEPPHLIPAKSTLWQGNWMIIGTAIPSDMFWAAEGFWEEPCFEDWSLWMRARALGCTLSTVPKAIYRVHIKANGRNESYGSHRGIFNQIIDSNRRWMGSKGLSLEI